MQPNLCYDINYILNFYGLTDGWILINKYIVAFYKTQPKWSNLRNTYVVSDDLQYKYITSLTETEYDLLNEDTPQNLLFKVVNGKLTNLQEHKYNVIFNPFTTSASSVTMTQTQLDKFMTEFVNIAQQAVTVTASIREVQIIDNNNNVLVYIS